MYYKIILLIIKYNRVLKMKKRPEDFYFSPSLSDTTIQKTVILLLNSKKKSASKNVTFYLKIVLVNF
ncbi:hypothetical protein B566_EDAN003594 [Ephemera danica]|nr:hypothetical protein B566_EDAN003594 [Ephemera danica]